jgi:hypothetical protein
MTEENKYDGLFMTIMQQTKDINVFFDAVFGFLRYWILQYLDEAQTFSKMKNKQKMLLQPHALEISKFLRQTK